MKQLYGNFYKYFKDFCKYFIDITRNCLIELKVVYFSGFDRVNQLKAV